MKYLTALFAITLTITGFSQIEVEDYVREIKIDVERVGEVPPLRASSSCGEVSVELKEDMFSGGCLGTLVRTFTFRDGCGNEVTTEQYLTLQDTEAPVFSMRVEDVEYYGKVLPPLDIVLASDNGGKDVDIEFDERKEGETVVREWIATDYCGNQSKMKQVLKRVKNSN